MLSVSATVHSSSSFHPTSQVTFTLRPHNPVPERCKLHLLYKLSPSVFIDPYELAQRQASYTFVKWGPTEIERPVHAVENQDTLALLTVVVPPHDDGAGSFQFDVDVPLHARYLAPISKDTTPLVDSGNYRHFPLERPQAFFACPREYDHNSPTTLPAYISASQLAEANMTLSTTQFIQIPYSPNSQVDFIRIPVGRKEDLPNVQVYTAAIILSIFIWISVSVVRTASYLRNSSGIDRLKTE
ncbi:hypothetical protein D9756_003563 [Leucocoprinus leucothites]|uniref:Protein PBN1 n=1 Tax=Leucocoprinus leucothites TaxID=201217 RepID=A0A8H5G6H7_9AGAR|nr:hypothetical protein D9756_003563 [Leucoagaricus leucothites]